MSTIVLRSGVNRALTSTEIDANFGNLNTDKVETTAPVFSGTVTLPSQSVSLTESNLPDVPASLNLDFANSKQLDSRITFGRGSGGAYYDGKTTAKAEENLLKYSQDFAVGSSIWYPTDVTLTGGQTAPDGTSTANKLIATVTGSAVTHNIYYNPANIVVNIGNIYTVSFYTKAAEYSKFYMKDYYGGIGEVSFDLNGNSGAGSVISVAGSSATASITLIGNSWYRCTVTYTQTIYTTVAWSCIGLPSSASTFTYIGDGTSGIYIWGAQLEQRSAVTAYTPTTSAPITNYIPVLLQAPLNTPRFDHDSRPTFNGTCTVSGSAVTLPTTFADGSSPSTINKFYIGSITISGTAYVITNYVGSTRVVTVTGSPTAGAFSLTNKNYGQSLGLLIEEARENKLFYSGAIGSGNWSIQGSVNTLNTEIAPDGTLTASSSVPTAISAQQRHYSQYLGVTSAISYTYSVYAKKGGYSGVYIRDGYSGYNNVFDLNSGTVAISIGSVGTITSVGNGWYRCTSTMIPSGVNAQMNIGVTPNGSISATTLYTGDGYSGIYIWGAQLEAGSFATSYIPTPSNATVTRQPDLASMTGTNFSSWYNQSEGSFYYDIDRTPLAYKGEGSYIFYTSNTSRTSGLVTTEYNNSSFDGYTALIVNGTLYFNMSTLASTYTDSSNHKGLVTYKTNNVTVAVDGTIKNTSTNAPLMPLVDKLEIGGRADYPLGQYNLKGHIRKLSYYPKALSAPQLQGLTK